MSVERAYRTAEWGEIMGINIWAAVILGLATISALIGYGRSRHLGDLATALLAIGIGVAFFAAEHGPLLHP